VGTNERTNDGDCGPAGIISSAAPARSGACLSRCRRVGDSRGLTTADSTRTTNAAVTNAIRLLFDGHSTTHRRSL